MFLLRCNRRPEAIAFGLLFFLIAVCRGSDRSFLHPLDILSDFIIAPWHLPLQDSTSLFAGIHYQPVFREHGRDDSDKFNSIVDVVRASAGYVFSGKGMSTGFRCTAMDMFAAVREDDARYGFDAVQRLGVIDAGFGVKYPLGKIYAGIGRQFSREYDTDTMMYFARHDPVEYLSRGPWSGNIGITMDRGLLHTAINAASQPTVSLSGILFKTSRESFRSFPLSIISHSVDIGINYGDTSRSTSLRAGLVNAVTAQYLESRNIMPSDAEVTVYWIETGARVLTPISDSLVWKISATAGGGWAEVHNFFLDGLTFFQADSLKARSVIADVHGVLPLKIRLCARAGILDIISPRGILSLSPLSSWSVFKPVDYRYRDAHFRYTEAGGEIGRGFKTGAFGLDLAVGASYFATRFNCNYDQRKIIVLFPVWSDHGRKEFWQIDGLIICPVINFTYAFRKLSISAQATQRFPIVFDRESGGSLDSSQENGENARTTGGTVLRINGVIGLGHGTR